MTRLRFAPSPTGMFHVGSARTALFNWLHARRHGGTLVLRVEDTDAERNQPEWIEMIFDSMRWLGMDWDEGPYFQSTNASLHSEAGARLFETAAAYYCDCAKDDVVERTGDKNRSYDGFCRERKLEPGEARALRFAVPEGKTIVHDLIRGDVTFPNESIDDFVIVRSNGAPLYMLANVVDDVDQRISHVVRGDDHLPNTPKQIMIWQALSDEPVPTYAHLPLIVNESGKKLSKRRDKVALGQFREEGILPEAMRNYLSLLGWSPDGDEIVSIEDSILQFDLGSVQPSPAKFDVKKLAAFNGDYIRALSVNEFILRCEPYLDASAGEHWQANAFSPETFAKIAPLVQSRVSRLDEVAPMVAFFFVDHIDYDDSVVAGIDNAGARAVLSEAADRYSSCEWTTDTLHELTAEIGTTHGLKLGKAQAPIRIAVTGSKVGPPLFESLELLGREVTLDRIRELSGRLGG